MDRVRILLAIFLILLAPLIWRPVDYLTILWPSNGLFAICIGFVGVFFVWFPALGIRPQTPRFTVFLPLSIAAVAYFTGPLSNQTTLRPKLNHCGPLTFTGALYPLHSLATDAFRNDLEAKNQMCWLRKMIDRIPETVDNHYFELMAQKLERPEIKFRASLPFIAFLHGKLFVKLESTPLGQFQDAKNFLKSLGYWEDLYAYEISDREYAWYDWPYSAFVQFEYGLIEGNWKNLVVELKTQ